MTSIDTFKHTPATVEDLNGLVAWSDFWAARPALFADKNKAAWFIRTRRGELAAAGVLFDSVRGYLVNEAKLEAMLPALLSVVRLSPQTTGEVGVV